MSHQAKLDNTKECPLCRGLNHCAAQSGAGIEQCWCSKQTFPDKRLLANVLGAEELLSLSGTTCICEACLQRLQQLLSQDSNLYKRID